ncbi:MAG: hypothetical protein AAGG48_10525 [Planctomycetota bacterium]
MTKSLGRTLGWIAFVCAAIWLCMGAWQAFGTGEEEADYFANLGLPFFAMIASILLISGVMDRKETDALNESDRSSG